jgi:hypothetical protein
MKINNPFQTYNRGYTARERRIRTKYASLFLVTGLACIWLTVKNYNDAQDLEKTEVINTILQTQTVKLKNQVDSLRSELFISSSIIGRHELSLDYIKETDPKAARNYEYFFEHETE